MITGIAIVGCQVCVQTVMFTCAKTLGLMKCISQDNHLEVLNDLLFMSDIKKRVAKIHKLLTTMNEVEEPIKMAIQDLHENITLINQLLETCISLRDNHCEKYLANWRSLVVPHQDLGLQIQIFNIRFDDLVKMTTIVKNIS